MTEIIYFTGIIASCMVLFGSFNQLIKTYRLKRMDDFSWNYLLWISCAVTLYIIFGLYINEPVVYIGNFICMCIYIGLLSLKYKYRKCAQ